MHPDFSDIEQEIERFSSLGLRGLKLHPDFQQFYIDEPRMDRLYRAVGNKFPILLHVGDENSDYSAPERLAKVIDRMPDVVFIAAHFGGYGMYEEAYALLKDKDCIFDVSSSLMFLEAGVAERYIRA